MAYCSCKALWVSAHELCARNTTTPDIRQMNALKEWCDCVGPVLYVIANGEEGSVRGSAMRVCTRAHIQVCVHKCV